MKIKGIFMVKLISVIILAALMVGSVECDLKNVNAVPGETLTYNLEVTNNEARDKDTRLTYSAPDDFSGKFLYNGREIESLTLRANEMKTVQFRVEVPPEVEEEEYFIWVYATENLLLKIKVKMPEEPVKISPSITGVAIEAGDIVTFPLTVQNTLNTEYVVDLSCSTPQNWTYKFVEGGKEVYQIVLDPNEIRSLQLEVESDSSSSVKEYELEPFFNHQSVQLRTKITETHKGEPGKIEAYVVGEDGRPVESAKVNISGLGDYYTSATGESTIECPESTYLVVISKEGYYQEEVRDVEVKAGKTTDLRTVTLEQKPHSTEVTVSNPRMTTTIGSNPIFKFRIANRGYADEIYSLRLEGLPEGFYPKFKESLQSTEGISDVFIEGDGNKDVYLEILIPSYGEVGTYNLTLEVDGHHSVRKNLTLDLKGEYRVHFQPSGGRYLVTTEAGDKANFEGILSNIGRGTTLTNLNITADTPPGWEIEVNPSGIPALQNGESQPLTLAAYVPADALPSEYKLQLSIKSDQAEIQEELKVIVQEKSYAGIIGGGIILATLVGLIFIFKKFGRR